MRQADLLDCTRAQMGYFQKNLAAKDAVVSSIAQAPCATHRLWLTNTIQKARKALNKPVIGPLRIRSIVVDQFHAETVIRSINLFPLRGDALEECWASSEGI